MASECPAVEIRAPGVVVARYEWPHQLLPELQGDCLACALAASARGPVGLVFVLAERICEVAPSVRGFWRKVVSDPAFRITAMAIVTTSWAVEVEAMGFAAIIERIGSPLRVATFGEEHEGIAWVARTVRSAQLLCGGTT